MYVFNICLIMGFQCFLFAFSLDAEKTLIIWNIIFLGLILPVLLICAGKEFLVE